MKRLRNNFVHRAMVFLLERVATPEYHFAIRAFQKRGFEEAVRDGTIFNHARQINRSGS